MNGRGIYAGALALVGLAAYFLSRKAAARMDGMPTETALRGWEAEEDVILTAWIEDAADRLVDAGAPLFKITSGKRSTARQVRAMFGLIESGADLHGIYADDDLVDQILAVYPDEEAAEAILEENPISAHQRGEAFDVHLKDDDFASKMIEAGERAGIRVLDERPQGNTVLHIGA